MEEKTGIETIVKDIARDLKLSENSVRSTVKLLSEDCTIPFIARYRKEVTGSLDETVLRELADKLEYYRELDSRKKTILKTIGEQGKLTPQLEKKIRLCRDKNKLEDLYLPYKPKKRTRATIARELGLAPLAAVILRQQEEIKDKKGFIEPYLNPEKGIETHAQALAGALDIIAEEIADNETIRGWMREMVKQYGIIASKARKDWVEKKSKFQIYYDFREPLSGIPSHRLLAIRRGTKENVLSWKIEVPEEKIIDFMEREVIKNSRFAFCKELKTTVQDSYKRLLFPSIEKEALHLKLENKEQEAIEVFSRNLKNLLLAAPAGSKVIMGIDPGIRTGCKMAVIDEQGDVREFTTVYLNQSRQKKEEAEGCIVTLVKKYRIALIAIGNGTYSRETDDFIREVVEKHTLTAMPVVVSEAGASVYSASPLAVKEFPQLDVTLRGAVSIARRLQDPLAELVKIDPKAIGVGQYQHDVNQKELKKSLDRTVESCVNYVGVELNTASVPLLSYISGLGPAIAENIARYRSEHGAFSRRMELLKVPKLGPKAFQQCAGFLRLRNGSHPLDNSSIHPEAYPVVEKMAADCGVPVGQIIGNKQLIGKIDKQRYVTGEIGIPTLTDILQELKKPGLDPRQEFQSIRFSSYINELEDLSPEMILEGVVTNVTNFGAFVDLGVHQDGLIHISRLSDSFVKDPHDIVAVGDRVRIKILAVDPVLKRISLQRIV